jgi:hypothetical protein
MLSSIGSWWKILQTVHFEEGAQTLMLHRFRRGDPRDLDGWWRVLEEKRRNLAGRWIKWSCEEVSDEGFLKSKDREE